MRFIAFRQKFARYAAHDMHVPYGRMRYISRPQELYGCPHGESVVLVIASRYDPSPQEERYMREIHELCEAKQLEVIEWILD